MIAADGEHAALFHRSVDIKNVIGRAAAHIDDQSTEIFLVLGEHDLSGGERAEDDIFHFERQLFHASDGVLDASADAVNDVKISLQLLPEHSDRTEHAVLAVDVIMLNDGMQKCVLGGNAYFARINFYILNILLVDLVALFRKCHATAIVKALDVRAGYRT